MLPVLTYTAAARRRRRAAVAGVDTRPGQGARGPARPRRARPSPGAPSAARSARRTGRPAPRRGTSTPTSRWRSSGIASSPATSRWRPTAASQVLVETARLWLSLGHHDRHGVWHLDGVTGPDEYTAVVRDNVFTNLMAAHNLRTAAEACARHPEAAHAMGVTTEEMAAWRDAADAVAHPVRRGARRAPAVRGLHHPSRSGTSRRTRPIRCCCTSRTCGCTRRR